MGAQETRCSRAVGSQSECCTSELTVGEQTHLLKQCNSDTHWLHQQVGQTKHPPMPVPNVRPNPRAV